jgi:Tol biopolymer transport system component
LIVDNDVRSFSASADGRVLAFAGGQTLPEELSLYDRSGKKLETIPAASPYLGAHVEFSPDGRRLLLERNTGENVDLWTVELGRKVVSRLTFNEASETCGVWSADGQTVYFYSSRPQVRGAIYSIPSNGTGAEKLVHKVQTHHMHASPNGQ